jgi:hypothetical protein
VIRPNGICPGPAAPWLWESKNDGLMSFVVTQKLKPPSKFPALGAGVRYEMKS